MLSQRNIMMTGIFPLKTSAAVPVFVCQVVICFTLSQVLIEHSHCASDVSVFV